MKKHILALFLFVFLLSSAKAQYAFIPDTNFRNFLMTNGFAGCMSGALLDTTCAAVVTVTKINCAGKNIYSLTGIEYFDNLDTLMCDNNFHLSSIPRLPDSLTFLSCNHDSLTSLPALPFTLTYLNCGQNHLTTLPSLPLNLETLYCNSNELTLLPSIPSGLRTLLCPDNNLSSLPALPTSLTDLNCGNNLITALPFLASQLIWLCCDNNLLTSLPSLPASLTTLLCQSNQLTSLPPLPSILNELTCNSNQLTSLPALPSNLQSLGCGHNQLSFIPTLPATLTGLDISFNPLSVFPLLPSGLISLGCDSNGLGSLPAFPFSLGSLQCSQNSISSLPVLPPTLKTLYCNYNLLTSLPTLPDTMFTLDCSHNQITSISNFPDSIYNFKIDSNPISCLPEIHKIGYFYWSSTGIHCVPNYGHIYNATPSISNLHLCQLTDSCPSMWNMTGQVFFDVDSNCVQDTNEISLKDIPVALDSGGVQLQEFLTDNFGRYSFRTGIGNYTVRIDTAAAPFRVVCPASFFNVALLSPADSMDTIPSFGLLCNTGFDLTARSISPGGMFRPGNQQTLYLNAGDGMMFSGITCATSVSGSVQAIVQGLVSYVSPAAGALTPASINGDTITWSINDFSLVDPVHDFNIVVQVSIAATANDSVCVQLNILPTAGDNISSNNLLSECFPIRNSFDPNEKYMSPSGAVDSSQQWFTFTIFFQNSGNAPANDIYILDTLDQNLDATTFTYLSSSHDVITQLLAGNILRFNYPEINLIDSATNEPASHGYVQFKIKRKENLPLSTTISNIAHIFFDYNAPVATNNVSASLHHCPPMVLNYSTTNVVCPGTCINFQNMSNSADSYQWFFPGAVPDTSTAVSPVNICYAHGGHYDVTLIANCMTTSDTLARTGFVIVSPAAGFNSSPQNICPGSCVNFMNLSFDATSYQWTFAGAVPSTSTQTYPNNICYTNPGVYPVTLVVSNSMCSDSLTYNNYITVYSPATLSILQSDDTLFASAGFANYQWYLNGNSLSGATNSLYVAGQNGNYTVACVDTNGCSESADLLNVMTVISSVTNDFQFAIFPNPVSGLMTVTYSLAENSEVKFKIVDVLGNKISETKESVEVTGRYTLNYDTSDLPEGIYLLQMHTRDKIISGRFAVVK